MVAIWSNVTPDVLLLGQITVDDTVPSTPGPWHRRLGGNALYSAAGARLWCAPERIGVVARVPCNLPFSVHELLAKAHLPLEGLVSTDLEPLIEWIVYEEDGNRQSMPRNASLRDPSATAGELLERYLCYLVSLSASYEDIPRAWLPAKSVHLAPQVLTRHRHSCCALAGKTKYLSVDPSPHYSRGSNAAQLAASLQGATAFLPSQAEIQHLAELCPDWASAVIALQAAGFAEVVLKRGAAGVLLASDQDQSVISLPAAYAVAADLTGAGDSFSGAYAASRALGHSPRQAATRAIVAAAMVVECSGAEQALALNPQTAESRLQQYLLNVSV